MSTKIIKGQMFGRWEVIKDEEKIDGRWKCLCKCTCDKKIVRYVDKYNLLGGKSLSCGCLSSITAQKNFKTHGKSQTRLYHVWSSMKARCYNPNNRAYPNYGGRNISICDEWKNDFTVFEKWSFENGYDENAPYGQYTIDRIDVDKSYSPDNCRWITLSDQNNNRTSTIWLTYKGKTQTLLEWARELNLNPKLIRRRYDDGCPIHDILSPLSLVQKNNTVIISFNGESHSIAEWANITGISISTLYTRHRRGWPVDKMLTYNSKILQE